MPRSDDLDKHNELHTPTEDKHLSGAKFRGFISEKLRNPFVSLTLALFLALFCALVYWLFLI